MKDNKLIAVFMGMKPLNNDSSVLVFSTDRGNDIVSIDNLQYQNDWNLLMEVVERIEKTNVQKLSFNFNIQKDRVSLYYIHTSEPKKQIEMWLEFGQKTKIENTYKIVIEFIKWYNNEKTI